MRSIEAAIPTAAPRPYLDKLTYVLRVADAVAIVGALALASELSQSVWAPNYTAAAISAVALFYLVGGAQGLYRRWGLGGLLTELLTVWLAWSVVVPVLLLAAFVAHVSAEQSRFLFLAWFVIAPSVLSLGRMSLRMIIGEFGALQTTVAIAGASELGQRMARTLVHSPWGGVRLEGFYDDRDSQRLAPVDASLGSLQGNLDTLVGKAAKGEIDVIYLALPLRAEPRAQALIRKLADTAASVFLACDFPGFEGLHRDWSSVGAVPVMRIMDTPFQGASRYLKRLEDIVVGSLILALVSLPMLVISLGVRLSSRGPVLFRQRRYGLNGEEIRVLKFRSMTVCEDGDSIKQAKKNDNRITPFGAFLRRTSLDEFPQFLQVITGEMSIVGPRPHAVAHNELYRGQIKGYMQRHMVKPGITGWAQVNGFRGETETVEQMRKRVEHDLHYIRNWSLLLDLKIILLTIFGSKVRKNAY